MNETLKQFSEALAANLKAAVAGHADFIEKVQKASGDDRSFEVVMSTSDDDRQGDALDQSGWDFKYYEMNPVVLWAHNYASFPIGVITDLRVQGDKTVATGKFAPAGMNPEADLACALYQEKILRAVSPGYIQNDDGTRELLEVSFCPVPAGRYALSMRQVRSLGLSTRELMTKGFFFDEKAVVTQEDKPPEKKSPQLGDNCELDDGTPGVLADDPGNPGTMVCVPPEGGKSQKSNETQDNMNDELTKNLKAEHGRHQEAIAKSIDEFQEKSFDKDGGTPNDSTKEIDEFEEKMGGEQDEHLEKCMKALDDHYAPDPEEKKSIDEFKKAFEDEHLNHVKAMDKSISGFKDAWADGDDSDRAKAIDDFKTKANEELDRHEAAHDEMVKAEFGEGQDDGKSEEKAVIEKSGRSISAKTKEKLAAVVKSLDDMHDAHGKSTDNVIAALKELMAPPQGDEGKEDQEEKSSDTPNARSSSSGAATNKETSMSELDTYLFAQRLLRQVKSASEDGLRQVKDNLKSRFPSRR